MKVETTIAWHLLMRELSEGLKVLRWRSIGLNLTVTAALGSGALLYTAKTDILPQETLENLNGK